ncbi:MAG: hypothetical protein J1E80_05205 [Desulfovibrionaceae bacterium]|nr:hypothetical protein [Desulfovibrionaceae bacterium]
MALWSSLPLLGTLLDKVAGLIPDRSRAAENQARINEQELSNAPASRLRLWRSFLGWCLTLCFVWEVMIRPLVITYFPDWILPPSMLTEISRLLLGMLGLGF